MSITRIHSFLVRPGKHLAEQPAIHGVEVPHKGQLFDMLSRLDSEALAECKTEIIFRPGDDGEQQNPCRDLCLAYLKRQSLANGQALASRLQLVTNGISGLGLFFVIGAKDHHGLRLLLSRFPVETGVMAEEHGNSLDVKFVEKVFMKNARSYKCVLYRCATVDTGFWDGVAVDRQAGEEYGSANYWINGFLASELRNTPAAATERLAKALEKAIRDESVAQDDRHDMLSAARLIRSRDGKTTTAEKILKELGLSDTGIEAVKARYKRPELFDSTFQFDLAEFVQVLPYRAVSLDNGGMMIADAHKFDQVFRPEPVAGNQTQMRFSTFGNVVEDKLRKSK
jgi:hypothetical protein